MSASRLSKEREWELAVMAAAPWGQEDANRRFHGANRLLSIQDESRSMESTAAVQITRTATASSRSSTTRITEGTSKTRHSESESSSESSKGRRSTTTTSTDYSQTTTSTSTSSISSTKKPADQELPPNSIPKKPAAKK
eukprot:2093478-Heterocapsa_arctica.AAC.1